MEDNDLICKKILQSKEREYFEYCNLCKILKRTEEEIKEIDHDIKINDIVCKVATFIIGGALITIDVACCNKFNIPSLAAPTSYVIAGFSAAVFFQSPWNIFNGPKEKIMKKQILNDILIKIKRQMEDEGAKIKFTNDNKNLCKNLLERKKRNLFSEDFNRNYFEDDFNSFIKNYYR